MDSVVSVSISTETVGLVTSWPYHKEERMDAGTLAAVRAGSSVTTYDARERAVTRWVFTCTVSQAEDLWGWLDKSAVKLKPSAESLAAKLTRAALDVRAAVDMVRLPTERP